jgi:hypothetical protein
VSGVVAKGNFSPFPISSKLNWRLPMCVRLCVWMTNGEIQY